MNFAEPVAPVLVAGIGNILLQDDGFGPQAIARLESEYEFGPEVELLDIGTPALDFVDYLAGRELVILLDALSCGGEPGEILVFDRAQLERHVPGMRLSAHQPCLQETLFAAQTAGIELKKVTLVGVVGSSFGVGTQLGTCVSNAMSQALQTVCETLSRYEVQVRRKPTIADQQRWWTKGGANSGEKAPHANNDRGVSGFSGVAASPGATNT